MKNTILNMYAVTNGKDFATFEGNRLYTWERLKRRVHLFASIEEAESAIAFNWGPNWRTESIVKVVVVKCKFYE